MLKIKSGFMASLIALAMVLPAQGGDFLWVGRDSGATQCGCTPARTLAHDQAVLEYFDIPPLLACWGYLDGVAYCAACCVCSAGVLNFYLIGAEFLPAAQEAGWRAFDEFVPTECVETTPVE